MNEIEALYEVTEELESVLHQAIHAANREFIIERVNQLIEQRTIYLQRITPPFSKKEKELGEQMIRLNDTIKHQMNELFNQLKFEMQQLKKQKRSNQSYINPYENVDTMDGMFLDNKL